MPADDYESDTPRSLKEVIAELKRGETSTLSDDLFDAVERLLYTYQVFPSVRQGVRKNIGTQHKNVSWYLTERDDGRALINYQDGVRAKWLNDCYADDVPLWLLISLFRRIQRRKPLGDQEADETIARVDDLDATYMQKSARSPHYASYVEDVGGGGDDE
jgi:hypothetical protein